MRGDREAAGVAGISAVGTALATLASNGLPVRMEYVMCGVSVLLACALLVLFGRRRRMGFFWLMMFFLSFSSAMSDAVSGWYHCGFSHHASRLASSLGALIDSVPYSDERVHGLVKALVMGDRSGLSPALKAAFRKSGASHLLALSGMHIGILYLLTDKVTTPFFRSPAALAIKRLVMMAAAILYTVTVGAGPSITRACLFICIRETACLLDRPVPPVRVFSISLTLQLFLSPSSISDPGFQLSYLAMAGILFLFPRLEAVYPEKGAGVILRKIWSGATLSISCQIFTAPAAWYHFRSLPLHFLMTNLLAAPMMTAVLVAALAAIVLTAAGACPSWAVIASEGACRLLIMVIETVSAL